MTRCRVGTSPTSPTSPFRRITFRIAKFLATGTNNQSGQRAFPCCCDCWTCQVFVTLVGHFCQWARCGIKPALKHPSHSLQQSICNTAGGSQQLNPLNQQTQGLCVRTESLVGTRNHRGTTNKLRPKNFGNSESKSAECIQRATEAGWCWKGSVTSAKIGCLLVEAEVAFFETAL